MNVQPVPVWGAVAATVLALAWPASAPAQVTITSSDMFNKVGQYYEAYVEKDAVVSGLLGSPDVTPQAWDFTAGPTNAVYRFDYVDVGEAPDHGLFPEAAFVERLTDVTEGTEKFLFLDQKAGVGRVTMGFHDPEFSASHPTSVFTPAIRDFPETMGFGDAWTVSTEFESEIGFGVPEDEEFGGGLFSIPTRVTYTASSKVDAFGLVNQPGIGFGECLRVNELAQYDIAVDFGFGDGFQTVATQFVRNLYWLRKGHGIVVQATSRQLDTPPPDDFTLAAALVRMYRTNHEEPVVEVPSIRGLKMTLGKEGALLQWTKASGISRYRVEFAESIGRQWQTLVESTTANFTVDSAAGKPGAAMRLYRVVGLN